MQFAEGGQITDWLWPATVSERARNEKKPPDDNPDNKWRKQALQLQLQRFVYMFYTAFVASCTVPERLSA